MTNDPLCRATSGTFCDCPGADYWFKQGLVIAMLRVQQCLSWDDEQVDDDGFPRQVIWQDHAIQAIRAAFDNSAPDASAECGG